MEIKYLLFLLVLLFPSVTANPIYANASNSGPEDGLTAQTGYDTLQEAINDANSGGIVYAFPGTYTSAILNKTLNLTGEAGAIIQGAGTGRGLHIKTPGSGNVNISGFEITDFQFGVYYSDTNSGAVNLVIEGNNINGNSDKGIFLTMGTEGTTINNNTIQDNVGGLGITCSSHNRVIGNQILNNSLFGLDYSGASCTEDRPRNNTIEDNNLSLNIEAGIYMAYTKYNLIHNNHVENNSVTGIQFGRSNDNNITNNKIKWNGLTGKCGVLLTDSVGNAFKSNTISNNRISDVCADGESNTNNTMQNETYGILSIREARNSVDNSVNSNATIGDCSLEINLDSQAYGVELNITKYTNSSVIDIDALMTNVMGEYFDLETSADNITDIIFTMEYTDEDVAGHVEADMKPYVWNTTTETWLELTTSLSWVNDISHDIEANTFTLNISHFSTYAFGIPEVAPPPPPPGGSGGGQSKNKIVILANSIDHKLSFGLLTSKAHEVIRATPETFETYKTQKFIIILGGPDAPEGVGEIVADLLEESEEAFIRSSGNRKMFIRTNVWTRGQIVLILAGADREETRRAAENNKKDVASRSR